MHRIRALVMVILSLAVVKVDPQDTFRNSFGLSRHLMDHNYPPYDSEEEYIRHIHSMINAYRSDMVGGRLIIETDSTVDTKYRTWKRNADIINSLLALPKGMNDAGR